MDTIKQYLSGDDRKLRWVRPELRKLEAGAAESQRAAIADGSGQQAS